MKADETRRNLINELNAKYKNTGSFFSASEDPGDPVITFPSPTFEKPKMFEPLKINTIKKDTFSEINDVRGIGFKDNIENSDTFKLQGSKKNEPIEIYNMQELIQSNPDGMRTLSIDTRTVKAQYALVKRKDWQDILFEDVDWFRQIDLSSGIKKMFHISV